MVPEDIISNPCLPSALLFDLAETLSLRICMVHMGSCHQYKRINFSTSQHIPLTNNDL
jgi:hypothetical protein